MTTATPARGSATPRRGIARLLSRPALIALLVALWGGALCGEAAWWCLVAQRAEVPPPGWLLEPARAPYQLTDLAGDVGHRNDAWSLAHWRGLAPDPDSRMPGDRRMAATLRLEEGSQLEVILSPNGGIDSASLLLERIGEPSARLLLQQNQQQRESACSERLSAPGEGPLTVEIRPGQHDLTILLDQDSTSCSLGFLVPWEPTVRPGLRRVHIESIALDGASAAKPPAPPRALAWVAGALAALVLVVAQLLTGARAGVVAITALPLLVAGLLSGRDPAVWAETARVTWLPVPWLPVLGPVLVSGFMVASHQLGRALRGFPWTTGLVALRPWLGAALWIAASLAVLVALGGARAGAVIWASWLASSWGVLVWANANARKLRAYNLICLASCAALAVGAEAWLRQTPADGYWDAAQILPGSMDIMRSVEMADDGFAQIDQGEHTSYPDRGYPVAIAPPDGRPRLVAMGGSTTGGAWQNDDLDEFYPARLGAYLGGSWQVLNQGVGGWTTWHLRHYLDRGAVDLLEADVLVLYVGHNDLLTPAPAPYRQLYARWLQGGGAAGELLDRSRLYQGLRYGLTSLRPASHRTAVPVEHARDNLEWIIERTASRDTQLFLVSEGLAPDPAPMAEYNRMMMELSESNAQVHYLDAAAALHDLPGSQVFLDDCHLTAVGHDLLAQLLADELAELDLLSAPIQPLAPAVNAAPKARPSVRGQGPPETQGIRPAGDP